METERLQETIGLLCSWKTNTGFKTSDLVRAKGYTGLQQVIKYKGKKTLPFFFLQKWEGVSRKHGRLLHYQKPAVRKNITAMPGKIKDRKTPELVLALNRRI